MRTYQKEEIQILSMPSKCYFIRLWRQILDIKAGIADNRTVFTVGEPAIVSAFCSIKWLNPIDMSQRGTPKDGSYSVCPLIPLEESPLKNALNGYQGN